MKKKLSKEDKWFVIAGINLMAFGISGLALILTDALASPPAPTILLIVLGGLTSVFLCVSIVSYFIARLAMISQRNAMLHNEMNRLSQMLSDLKK